MWARTVEVLLGCWLALSPFIFQHPPGARAWWINDWACALAIITLALLSCWSRTRRAYLLNLGVAAWLCLRAYLSADGALPPAFQNELLAGLLLAMLAIIPGEAFLPPVAWRSFYAQAQAERGKYGA